MGKNQREIKPLLIKTNNKAGIETFVFKFVDSLPNGTVSFVYLEGRYTVGTKNTLTFKGDQGITGDIKTSVGENFITFEKGNLNGSLSAMAKWSSLVYTQNKLIFKENARLAGGVSAITQEYDRSQTLNEITFQKGGQIGSGGGEKILAHSTSGEASNYLIFGTKNSQNNTSGIIQANLEAINEKASEGKAENYILFHTKTNSITGEIKSYFGKNIIVSASNDQSAKIEMQGNLSTSAGKISVSAKDSALKVQGDIKSTGDFSSEIVLSAKSLEINAKSIFVDGESRASNINTFEGREASKITLSEGIFTLPTSNQARSANNLKLSKSAQSGAQDAFLSSNITNKGYTNIILENTSWISYDENHPRESKSGIIRNEAGVTNLVLRNILNNGIKKETYLIFSQGGETNLVLEKKSGQKLGISYKQGKVNLLFAYKSVGSDIAFIQESSQDTPIEGTIILSAMDTDSIKSSTNIMQNRILGRTYKDGIKLTLVNLETQIANQTLDLLGTFGGRFLQEHQSNLVIQTEIKKEIYYGVIRGLAIGALTSLEDTFGDQAQAVKHYVFSLNQRSAFVGSLDLKSDNVSLLMKNDSKLVIAGGSNHIKIQNLQLDQGITFDSTQTMQTIFDQTNTIINLATGVNDVYNAPTSQEQAV